MKLKLTRCKRLSSDYLDKNTPSKHEINMWDYAELTKMASEIGGPEELLELVEKGGYSKGVRTGIVIATAIIVPTFALGAKAYSTYRKKVEEAERAKQMLNDYMDIEEKIDRDWKNNHGKI